jgi:RNA polymerase sigma-70 factor (ECF subfamily)
LKDLTDILEGCRKNDSQAQFQLYNKLAPAVLGLCMRYLQNRDEAEDVMQDAFVKVFTKLHTYKGEGSFEGWVKRIAANTALNALQKKKRIYFERQLEIVETIVFDEEEQELLGLPEIIACMEALPDGYRTIVNLALIEDFTHREIAEQLGISESTSRSQLARARQALMKLLKEKSGAAFKKNA